MIEGCPFRTAFFYLNKRGKTQAICRKKAWSARLLNIVCSLFFIVQFVRSNLNYSR